MTGPGVKTTVFDRNKMRLDKWLAQARFFKKRELASDMVAEGHLRLNGQHCAKPGHGIGVGDVLTFPQGDVIRVIRILSLGTRRGPAPEAQMLYADLDALTPPDAASSLE